MECYCSKSVANCDSVTHKKLCGHGVSHCFLSLKWRNDSNKHVEYIQDCWPWMHEVAVCPDVRGPCYFISKPKDDFINCCCKGSLCNNASSIEVLPSPSLNSYSNQSLAVPPVTPSRISNVGVQLTGISNNHYGSGYLALVVSVPVITILLLVLLIALSLPFWISRFRFLRLRQTLVSSKRQKGCSQCSKSCHFLLNPANGICKCTCGNSFKNNDCNASDSQNVFSVNHTAKQFNMGFNGLMTTKHIKISSYINKVSLRARGRFGQVWHGRLKPIAQNDGADDESRLNVELDVAIKIFSSDEKRSWETEVALFHVNGLSHPNIVKYYGADQVFADDPMEPAYEYWLVTEYHELGSVYDYLHIHQLQWADLLRIAGGVARGLAHLHSEIPSLSKPSVAHRDLNSRNVLLKSDLTACIADFGLAIRFEPGQCMRDAHLQLGTRRYMAPEVLDGAIQFSRDAFLRIDVYAMGLVIWELMTRCRGSNPNNPLPDVPYLAPFEYELGLQPAMEKLQRWVALGKNRPKFQPQWKFDLGLCTLWETVEECWDQDAEARLSAGCVAERLSALYRQSFTSQTNSVQPVKADDCCDHLLSSSPSVIHTFHPPNSNHIYSSVEQLHTPSTTASLYSDSTFNYNRSTNCPPTVCLPVPTVNMESLFAQDTTSQLKFDQHLVGSL